jgi:hypothetical protein
VGPWRHRWGWKGRVDKPVRRRRMRGRGPRCRASWMLQAGGGAVRVDGDDVFSWVSHRALRGSPRLRTGRAACAGAGGLDCFQRVLLASASAFASRLGSIACRPGSRTRLPCCRVVGDLRSPRARPSPVREVGSSPTRFGQSGRRTPGRFTTGWRPSGSGGTRKPTVSRERSPSVGVAKDYRRDGSECPVGVFDRSARGVPTFRRRQPRVRARHGVSGEPAR